MVNNRHSFKSSFWWTKIFTFVNNNLQKKNDFFWTIKFFFNSLNDTDDVEPYYLILIKINGHKYALNLFGVPESCLPPCKHNYGTILIILSNVEPYSKNNKVIAANYNIKQIQLNVGLISSILFSTSKKNLMELLILAIVYFIIKEKKFNIDHHNELE